MSGRSRMREPLPWSDTDLRIMVCYLATHTPRKAVLTLVPASAPTALQRPTGRTPPRTPRGGVGGGGPGRGLLTGHKGSPPEPGAPIPQLGFVTCTRVHAAAHVCAWRWRMCVQCMEGGAQVRAVGTGAVVALITMRVVCFHSVFCSLHVAVWHSCFGLDVCRWGEPSPHTHRGGSADGKDAGMGVTVVSGSSWIALRHAVPDP